MEKDVYRRVQEQLDQYSIGFPATDSGIEIEILNNLFSRDEAELFNAMTTVLEPPEDVAARIGRNVAETAARLEDMASRGLLFRVRGDNGVRYSAIPFIHGLLEFQINNFSKEMIRRVGKYIREKLGENLGGNSSSFLRVIPVEQSVDVTSHIAPFDEAGRILENQETIVITDCACRAQTSLFNRDCGRPKDVCFMFGVMGEYYIENGMGRRIDLDEAMAILAKAHEAGLITQPAAAQEPFTMCNCCSDCCGFLRGLKAHPRPAEMVHSNFQARIDADRCSGCETCLERCQMEAIGMGPENTAVIDPLRCIGCGLCVTTCPEEAIALLPKPGEHAVPAADTHEQMVRLAAKRNLSDDPSIIADFGFRRAGSD